MAVPSVRTVTGLIKNEMDLFCRAYAELIMAITEDIRRCLVTNMSEYGLTQESEGVAQLIDELVEQLSKLYVPAKRSVDRASDDASEESATESETGSRRGKTNYSSFISKIARPEAKYIEVNINPRFNDAPKSKSKKAPSKHKPVYDQNASLFIRDSPIGIDELRELVSSVLKRTGIKVTPMTQSSFVWNLLSEEDRSKVLGCC